MGYFALGFSLLATYQKYIKPFGLIDDWTLDGIEQAFSEKRIKKEVHQMNKGYRAKKYVKKVYPSGREEGSPEDLDDGQPVTAGELDTFQKMHIDGRPMESQIDGGYDSKISPGSTGKSKSPKDDLEKQKYRTQRDSVLSAAIHDIDNTQQHKIKGSPFENRPDIPGTFESKLQAKPPKPEKPPKPPLKVKEKSEKTQTRGTTTPKNSNTDTKGAKTEIDSPKTGATLDLEPPTPSGRAGERRMRELLGE